MANAKWDRNWNIKSFTREIYAANSKTSQENSFSFQEMLFRARDAVTLCISGVFGKRFEIHRKIMLATEPETSTVIRGVGHEPTTFWSSFELTLMTPIEEQRKHKIDLEGAGKFDWPCRPYLPYVHQNGKLLRKKYTE